MVFKIMCVLITNAMSQFTGGFVMRILQMYRDRWCLSACHHMHGCINGQIRGITLGCTCHIVGSLSQDDLALRHADAFHCLCCCHGNLQSLRVCISHILCCTDHDASCDEFDILSGIEHPRQIIDSCVRVRSPHTLDKSRDCVVVVVPTLIILHNTPLDTFTRHG